MLSGWVHGAASPGSHLREGGEGGGGEGEGGGGDGAGGDGGGGAATPPARGCAREVVVVVVVVGDAFSVVVEVVGG